MSAATGQTGPTQGSTTNTYGGWGNVNYSDPNYWNQWNQTIGGLGAAVGSWVNGVNGNTQQYVPVNTQTQQNNTTMWIVGGIIAVVAVLAIVYLMRK